VALPEVEPPLLELDAAVLNETLLLPPLVEAATLVELLSAVVCDADPELLPELAPLDCELVEAAVELLPELDPPELPLQAIIPTTQAARHSP
jgi:hypothetical protein